MNSACLDLTKLLCLHAVGSVSRPSIAIGILSNPVNVGASLDVIILTYLLRLGRLPAIRGHFGHPHSTRMVFLDSSWKDGLRVLAIPGRTSSRTTGGRMLHKAN